MGALGSDAGQQGRSNVSGEHVPFFFFSTPRDFVLEEALELDLGIVGLVDDLGLDFGGGLDAGLIRAIAQGMRAQVNCKQTMRSDATGKLSEGGGLRGRMLSRG